MKYHGYSGAVANIRGNAQYPLLRGSVRFLPRREGTLVVAQIRGLPETATGFFGFHIHEGASCGGVDFSGTGGHFNPTGSPHPGHAGDLPPLLRVGGKAFLAVLTDRFCPEDVIGKTVVLHAAPDDFTSQPAGNAGQKIACGEIHRM